jgi:peroxiredoxin
MSDSINAQLATVAEEGQVPDFVSDLITSEWARDELRGRVGLRVGDLAPAFDLPDATGERVRLDTLLARGSVIVSFYRGEWCPYCNLTLHNWQTHLGEVADAGAQLVAITPQRPSDALTLTERHDLAFPVLSDLDQGVIRAYKLRHDLPASLKDLYQNTFGIDLTGLNADGSWSVVVPGTFVIDQERRVRFAHADLDWRVRAEPSDVLATVRAS